MSHRTRSNRPAYFDEYRAAFDRLAPDVQNDVLAEVEATTQPPYRSDYRPSIDRTIRQMERDAALVHATAKRADPQTGDTVRYWGELMEKAAAAWAVPRIVTVKAPRTDWRDGTDEGWGE